MKSLRLRALTIGLAAVLAAALTPLTATAQDTPGDSPAAADARAISQALFPDGADTIVVARDDEPIDALAAGTVIGAVDGPLVLTAPAGLSDAARAEIQRLGASSAAILGGTAAVSQAVEDQLVQLGLDVSRHAGDTRFGTATSAAALADGATTGILARAFPAEGNPTSVFADSIAAGALAAGLGLPLVLTETDVLTGATRQFLETSALTDVIVAGGTAAVAEPVLVDVESLGLGITRLAGDERTATAAALAGYADANGPGLTRVVLVDGFTDTAWASGFAAAAANVDGTTAVLLTQGDEVPAATRDVLDDGITEVLCGPNVTSTACAAAGGTPIEDGPIEGGAAFQHVGTYDITGNGNVVAEILDVTEDGQTLVFTDAETGTVGFVDLTDPAAPQGDGTVDVGGDITSAVVAGDHLLASVNTSPDHDNPSGALQVIDLATRDVVRTIDLGGQPDSAAVSPDGDLAAIAIENERDEEQDGGLIPQLPAGSLVTLDIAADDPADWTTATVDLTGLADVAPSDPEVEYVDINDDGLAVVTLQENNHLVLVDVASGDVVGDFSAGEVTVSGIDATEEELGAQGNGDIQLTETITRRREPDAAGWIGADRFATANEGDYEDADGEEGGSRSFTIFDVDGTVAYEAGNAFEYAQIRAGHYAEGRSANKGGEPEGIEVGTFDGQDLLFVGAERTNAVGVYDVSGAGDPTFLQLLPTGIGPEGLKAIPSRDLFVATSESPTDAVPALITIWQRSAGPPEYPQIVSADVDGVPVPWVALSGMAGSADTGETVHAVSDSILGVAYIYEVDTATTPATILSRTRVGTDDSDLDLEGIAIAPEGGFWVASEGRYADDGTEERANAILKVDADGTITDTVELPAALVAGATSSGFEGVAVEGDATTEFVYAVVQREWADDADGVVKIARYEVATGEWTFADYALDDVESPNGGWVGLSEITALPDGSFAVIERDNQLGADARIKRIYRIQPSTVDFAPYGQARQTIAKDLLADVLDDLAEASIWTPDKLESLAVTADGDVVIATDNDGLDDAIGQTVYLDLGDAFALVTE